VDVTLLERVRALLPTGHDVREIPMFGGLSVLLDDRMLVAVRRDESLLVRVDPARSAELLSMAGAEPASMGAHRSMGPGWIDVSGEAVHSQEQLTFWLQIALDHHAGSTGS
jgi:TfoX/Sxy family transcriptional regulator of competence genes